MKQKCTDLISKINIEEQTKKGKNPTSSTKVAKSKSKKGGGGSKKKVQKKEIKSIDFSETTSVKKSKVENNSKTLLSKKRKNK